MWALFQSIIVSLLLLVATLFIADHRSIVNLPVTLIFSLFNSDWCCNCSQHFGQNVNFSCLWFCTFYCCSSCAIQFLLCDFGIFTDFDWFIQFDWLNWFLSLFSTPLPLAVVCFNNPIVFNLHPHTFFEKSTEKVTLSFLVVGSACLTVTFVLLHIFCACKLMWCHFAYFSFTLLPLFCCHSSSTNIASHRHLHILNFDICFRIAHQQLHSRPFCRRIHLHKMFCHHCSHAATNWCQLSTTVNHCIINAVQNRSSFAFLVHSPLICSWYIWKCV